MSIYILTLHYIVIIDNELTAGGGGYSGGKRTNKLFTLCQGQWVKEYPPMSIALLVLVFVMTITCIIIIVGGERGEDSITTARS